MRIGFIGCVESSLVALRALLQSSPNSYQVVGIITKKKSSFNTDFVDLTPICNEYSIPICYVDETSQEAAEKFMQNLKVDVIFCIGWSSLLKEKFLTMAKHGVIGFHPAKLPANRGRHPIIWALTLGLKNTASTFFKMNSEADSGPIVDQFDMKIEDNYTARKLYDKILSSVAIQVPLIAENLAMGKLEYHEQNSLSSNTWRKRNSRDGIIDFRMRSIDIHNLVSALSEPYPGADVEYGKRFYKIWRSEYTTNTYQKNIEPGCVLEIKRDRILVKTAGLSAVYLWNQTLSKMLKAGDYL